MDKLSVMSCPEIVRMLGRRFRDYRMRMEMTQQDVSNQSAISVTTIHKFETGISTNISMFTFLTLLRAIGMIDAADNILPYLPPSPYLMNRQSHPKQRIRKKSYEL